MSSRAIGTPITVAKHYHYPLSELTGRGQKIAVFDFDDQFNKAILIRDLRKIGVTPNPDNINQVMVGTQMEIRGAFGETQEDVEIIASLCPDAEITVYTGGDMAEIITRAADDGNSVLSCSWGTGNIDHLEAAYVEAIESALEHAKTKNMTVCVAAGDGGSSNARGDRSQAIAAPDNQAHVGYPACSTYVLAVGGTMLAQDDHGVLQEVVWNNANTEGGATGGGVWVLDSGTPSWQSEAGINIPSANPNGGYGRVIPDVAAFASYHDYTLAFAYPGQGIVIAQNGGTSAATPMWASLIALANQKRASLGKGSVGWINEALYQKAQANSSLFIDITSGDNRSEADYPGYDATTGFDACTGWGSPNAPMIIQALSEI